MTATNTIPRDEYAQRLSEASCKVAKTLSRLSDEEESKSRTADNKGDNETALKHSFRATALMLATHYLTKTPHEWEKEIR